MWMTLLFAAVSAALAILAYRTGVRDSADQASWLVLEAKALSNTAAKLDSLEKQVESMSASLSRMKLVTETLDGNVGRLIMLSVKDRVRVRGVQVGEENSEMEAIHGRVSRPRPEAAPLEDQNPEEGFLVDGKVVPPTTTLEGALVRAEPT